MNKWYIAAFTLPEKCLQVHFLPSVEMAIIEKDTGVLTVCLAVERLLITLKLDYCSYQAWL